MSEKEPGRKYSFFSHMPEKDIFDRLTPGEFQKLLTKNPDMTARFIHEMIQRGRTDVIKDVYTTTKNKPSLWLRFEADAKENFPLVLIDLQTTDTADSIRTMLTTCYEIFYENGAIFTKGITDKDFPHTIVEEKVDDLMDIIERRAEVYAAPNN